MALDTLKQIQYIDSSLRWIEDNHPEHYEQRFLQLVNERRKMRKVVEAEADNPAIAAYGKSQVGKSYLVSCMLQQEINSSDGKKAVKPFEVDADGVKYNFINDINPITTSTEATGVVTRFSSFSRQPELYTNKYPVLMKCLSLIDVALILCDGYFNDVEDYTTDGRDDINQRAEQIYQKYIHQRRQEISPVRPDDILEMKVYFRKYINNAQEFNHSDFFNKLALVIDRIPVNEYVDVFSYFWHEESHLTALFSRLVKTLSVLGFSKNVYLPIEAVLHKGMNENTIMSVQCLDGLGTENAIKCDVFLRQSDGSFRKIADMNKSELSAVCAEVVYKIEDSFLESKHAYNFDYITDVAVRNQLTQTPVSMEMLQSVDLLDFPGARSRKKERSDTLERAKILTTVLLRGKVAYLFNKYSESKFINILLYCHDHEQNDVTNLYITLKEWVDQYVGRTPEERKRTIELTGNVSPLFYVATKFNIDLAEQQNPSANERLAIDGRWFSRFNKVLYKECFNADSVEWVKNWTETDEFFNNSFLLRDYKYSGPKGSKLYGGFENEGKETTSLISADYQALMRESFCNSKDASMFFRNRPLSWDVAATMNNDGTLYIIEHLKKASDAISTTRKTQFDDLVRNSVNRVLSIMKPYYVSDKTADILAENIRKANGIFREMEFTCQSHPQYFGHLLQALQLSEAESYKEIHRIIPKLTETTNDEQTILDYELIRKRLDNFNGCETDNQKWDKLVSCYNFASKQEAEEFLKKRNIDYRKLFEGSPIKRKNSAVISMIMMEKWKQHISTPGFVTFSNEVGAIDEIALTDLVDCMINAAENINLRDVIEKRISEYVDVLNLLMVNEALIADVIATTISDFVIDFGYSYFTSQQKDDCVRIAHDQHLSCCDRLHVERKETYEEEEMTRLFHSILDTGSRFTPAYEANYNDWLNFMYIAYISHIGVPDYDREANELLKHVLDAMMANM